MRNKTSAFFLALALVVAIPKPSLAQETKLKELEQKKIESQVNVENKKSRVLDIEKEQEIVLNEITELDLKIQDLESEIQKVLEEIELLEEDIEKAELEIQGLEKEIEDGTEDFRKRIKAMYINSQVGSLEVLLSSEDLSGLLSKASMMKFITEYDIELLNNLKHNKLEVDAKKAELAGKKAAAEILRESLEEKSNVLRDKINERYEKMESLSDSLVATEEDISNLEQELQIIEAQIGQEKTAIANKKAEERQRRLVEERRKAQARLQAAKGQKQAHEAKKTFSTQKNYETGNGQYGWPVPNSRRITSSFGYRGNPTGWGSDFHRGLDIAAGSGTPTVAASDGVVIHAGYQGSYGNLIKIRHDNGTETRYAHLSGYNVSTGQRVSRGDTIGFIGSTGNSTGPHLHFEILFGGSPVDPLYYVR